MSAKWEKTEGNEGVLTITVAAEDFNAALDQAFKKVVKDVQLPGFRKGRIPRNIFENRFGVESLYQDAVDIVLPEAYTHAVEETGIEPVDQPEIDIEEIEKGKDLIFTAKVTVKPEVQLGEYKGLEVVSQDVEVTDEDVETEIKSLQEQQAELVIKEEGTIEEGHSVVIDFEGFVDGEPFEGGKAENHTLEIGSGQFIPGFEEQLVGKESGDELDVEVTFPEEYHAEELAGQEAVFKVKIHEIKEKELPELDDEFAKDVDDDVETLDELKEKKKQELKDAKQNAADQATRESLINQVVEGATVDIPDAMIDHELDHMIQEFEQQLQAQGMDMEMYTKFSGQNEDELKNQMRGDAEKRVASSLSLEAIFKVENLEVSDEDVEKEFEKMAKMYGLEVDQVKQAFGANVDGIKNELQVQKAIDFLVEHSVEVEATEVDEETAEETNGDSDETSEEKTD